MTTPTPPAARPDVNAARRRLTDAMHAMHCDQRIVIDMGKAVELDAAWDAYDAALLAGEGGPAESPSHRRFYLHWLLHAYETLNRAGWEDGYSHEELSTQLLNVLCNSGLHPTDDRNGWMKLANEKAGTVPPKEASQ